jgi:hypothetical protein
MRISPVSWKQCLLGLGFSLILRHLSFCLLAFGGPMAFLARIVACVQVSIFLRLFSFVLDAMLTKYMGLLVLARLLANVPAASLNLTCFRLHTNHFHDSCNSASGPNTSVRRISLKCNKFVCTGIRIYTSFFVTCNALML